MHIYNCLKRVLFFWSLELSLLINTFEKEMLKPLFLQKLNSVGGSGVGRKSQTGVVLKVAGEGVWGWGWGGRNPGEPNTELKPK